MRFTDNKRHKNERVRKQKWISRDKKENVLGADTGFVDVQGNTIFSGSIVLVFPNKGDSFPVVTIAFVLWNDALKRPQYCAMRGCWYGERNPSDPRCYGKIEKYFNGKGGKYDTIKVVGQLAGNKYVDELEIENIFKTVKQ